MTDAERRLERARGLAYPVGDAYRLPVFAMDAIVRAVAAVYEAAIAEAVAAERERCAMVADANAMCASSYGIGNAIRKGTP
jgi:hypothetical protein